MLLLNLVWLVQPGSDQPFQPMIIIYRTGNFQLSYLLRPLNIMQDIRNDHAMFNTVMYFLLILSYDFILNILQDHLEIQAAPLASILYVECTDRD